MATEIFAKRSLERDAGKKISEEEFEEITDNLIRLKLINNTEGKSVKCSR